jgi:hypothetical protein
VDLFGSFALVIFLTVLPYVHGFSFYLLIHHKRAIFGCAAPDVLFYRQNEGCWLVAQGVSCLTRPR